MGCWPPNTVLDSSKIFLAGSHDILYTTPTYDQSHLARLHLPQLHAVLIYDRDRRYLVALQRVEGQPSEVAPKPITAEVVVIFSAIEAARVSDPWPRFPTP